MNLKQSVIKAMLKIQYEIGKIDGKTEFWLKRSKKHSETLRYYQGRKDSYDLVIRILKNSIAERGD